MSTERVDEQAIYRVLEEMERRCAHKGQPPPSTPTRLHPWAQGEGSPPTQKARIASHPPLRARISPSSLPPSHSSCLPPFSDTSQEGMATCLGEAREEGRYLGREVDGVGEGSPFQARGESRYSPAAEEERRNAPTGREGEGRILPARGEAERRYSPADEEERRCVRKEERYVRQEGERRHALSREEEERRYAREEGERYASPSKERFVEGHSPAPLTEREGGRAISLPPDERAAFEAQLEAMGRRHEAAIAAVRQKAFREARQVHAHHEIAICQVRREMEEEIAKEVEGRRVEQQRADALRAELAEVKGRLGRLEADVKGTGVEDLRREYASEVASMAKSHRVELAARERAAQAMLEREGASRERAIATLEVCWW